MPPGQGGAGAAPAPNGQPPGGPGGGGAQQNPQMTQNMELLRQLVSSARLLARNVPGAADIVRQINDLAQKLQMRMVQAGPMPQREAPPM